MNGLYHHTVILLVVLTGFITQVHAKSTDINDIPSMHYEKSEDLRSAVSFDLLRSIDSLLYYRELQKFAGPGIVFSASKPNTTHIASDDNIKISRRSITCAKKLAFTSLWEMTEQRYTQHIRMANGLITFWRSLLRDSCKESSDYELVTTGINEISQRVALHENTWIYTSRCASVNSSCKGVIRVQSACKQKKGWAKAYARKMINGRPHGSYSWQWISVDRSCNCAISFN